MKKILLLTDMPPCHNYTAGLVLERLVRFLPKDKIAICSVVNPSLADPNLKPIKSKDIEDITELRLEKPRETFFIKRSNKAIELLSFAFEVMQSLKVKYILLPQIINFIKEQKIELLWIVLEGQTMSRLADHLAKTKLPIHTQVWDALEWWLRANQVNRFTQKNLLKQFDKVILNSISCATASWEMSKHYTNKYLIDNIPVIAGLPKELAKTPIKKNESDEFIIALAGQIYAKDEWQALINCLNYTNWHIAGKKIKLRVLGGFIEFYSRAAVNIEYLGWHSQEETIKLLSESDLLYMPYWFSEEYRFESSTSFPSKLVSYFAAGKPVFCHAPIYASPTKYIAENDAGFLCTSLDSKIIYKELEKSITDLDLYTTFAENGRTCFLKDFTLEKMQENFFKFLNLYTINDQIPKSFNYYSSI